MGTKSTAGGGGGGGEIIQVQGGHIVRATGRKDRHSKVYTAKGPRDRRVRLSAHTAIQFYDVQDRLGYDRPSKAVDWLIKKAKSAIDKLAELPAWHPTDHNENLEEADQDAESSDQMALAAAAEQSESTGYSFQLHGQLAAENPNNGSSFIEVAPPPSVNPDAIADTMKSFFPLSSTTSSMNYQNYPPEIISRTTSNNHSSHEDLGLSLHPFQDHQGLIHGRNSQPGGDASRRPPNEHPMFAAASAPLGSFESSFQRMVDWSGQAAIENSVSGGEGFTFMPPQQQHALLMGQGSAAFAPRGPLQSSFAQSIRAWSDLPMASSTDHHHGTQDIHQSLIFGSRFASGVTDFSNIPARIHGQHDPNVAPDTPSSSSPNSQH